MANFNESATKRKLIAWRIQCYHCQLLYHGKNASNIEKLREQSIRYLLSVSKSKAESNPTLAFGLQFSPNQQCHHSKKAKIKRNHIQPTVDAMLIVAFTIYISFPPPSSLCFHELFYIKIKDSNAFCWCDLSKIQNWIITVRGAFSRKKVFRRRW